MNQEDWVDAFDMAMGFMNNVYCTPNSVNEDRIRRNARINPGPRAAARELFEQELWTVWFAKVKQDREVEMPAAIEALNAAGITTILDSYKGSPRIQAEFIAHFVEYGPQLVQIHDQTWRQILNTVAICSDKTPDARDMFLVACDILMSADKHDLNNDLNYRAVMLFLHETVEKKIQQHHDKTSSVSLSNTVIDAMCCVFLQMCSPHSASSEFIEGSNGEYVVFAAVEILHHILLGVYSYVTDDWPPEDNLSFHNSIRTRFSKITASLRCMMRTRNMKPSQTKIIQQLLGPYLGCGWTILQFFSVQGDGNSIRDLLELHVVSLEDTALENIRTCQHDPSVSGNARGGAIMQKNLEYANTLYDFRKKHELGALETAVKLVPVVIGAFVDTYGMSSHYDTLDFNASVIQETSLVTEWVVQVLEFHATDRGVHKIRTAVNNACVSPIGQICFLDIIAGTACALKGGSRRIGLIQDMVFRDFIRIMSVLCVPQCNTHPHTMRVLDTSKLTYKTLLISVYHFATHPVHPRQVARDLVMILSGLKVVLSMIAYNPRRITEETDVLIQPTLSYLNLSTLLPKLDALATTTPEIQAMSQELKRHMQSFWTNAPPSPPTGP